MTGRNLRLLVLIIIGCIVCAVQAQRMQAVNDVALAIDYIERMYIKPIDRTTLGQQAISGMMEKLDPYSSYIPPTDLSSFRSQIEQSFAGLGVVISKSDEGELRVVRTIRDAPAARAGLLAEDTIVKIDGTSAENMAIDQASALLRGKPKTQVLLTIRRPEQTALFDVSLTREIIETPSVVGDHRDEAGNTVYKMQADPRIAYIHMAIFGEQSAAEMKRFLKKEAADANAVIIDLRDNAGGLLDTARDICDMFLESGVIVTTEGRVKGMDSVIKATAGTLIGSDVPLVILIDEGSASASEVTAACLQDAKRAVVAGQRSYGKGSVQNVIEMDGGRAALRLTTAYWYSPSKRNINRPDEANPDAEWGVDPDPELEQVLTPEQHSAAFKRLFRRDGGDLTATENATDQDAEPASQDSPPVNRADLTATIISNDPSIAEDLQLLKVVTWLQSKL